MRNDIRTAMQNRTMFLHLINDITKTCIKYYMRKLMPCLERIVHKLTFVSYYAMDHTNITLGKRNIILIEASSTSSNSILFFLYLIKLYKDFQVNMVVALSDTYYTVFSIIFMFRLLHNYSYLFSVSTEFFIEYE